VAAGVRSDRSLAGKAPERVETFITTRTSGAREAQSPSAMCLEDRKASLKPCERDGDPGLRTHRPRSWREQAQRLEVIGGFALLEPAPS